MNKHNDNINGLSKKNLGLSIDNFNGLFKKGFNIQEVHPINENSFSAYPQVLTYITFPHRPIAKTSNNESLAWVKISGPHRLSIKSGIDIDDKGNSKPTGIPYGSYPRLIMAYITKQVLIEKSPEIELGISFNKFMLEIGLSNSSGKRGNSKRMKDQLMRLLKSTISYEFNGETEFYSYNIEEDYPVTIKRQISWWNYRYSGNEDTIFKQSTIKLSESFYNSIMMHSYPVDLRALSMLKQSPLAIDYYNLLAFKLPRLNKKIEIPWSLLHEQFGCDRKSIKKFAQESKKAIMRVLCLYSNANVDLSKRGCLILKPSKSHVPLKKY